MSYYVEKIYSGLEHHKSSFLSTPRGVDGGLY